MPETNRKPASAPEELSGDGAFGSDTASYDPTGVGTPASGRGVIPCSQPPPELTGHPRYEILGPLGAGGMGCVYKARHRFMDRPVALKVIHPRFVGRPAMVAWFLREMQTAARLDHPNIVRSFDADQAGSLHFLVMEYVNGVDLERVLADQGRLSIAVACDYARQAALGLQHAHEQRMVHRDVKPHNLMLTPEGRIKILDFGLARYVSEVASLVQPDACPSGHGDDEPPGFPSSGPAALSSFACVGTPDYMAPEEIRDPRSADIRADVYSLGCTLYRFLSGRVPFPAPTLLLKAQWHLGRAPEPLARLRSEIPADLTRTVERMMAKEPGDRPQTPDEAARALARFAAAKPCNLLIVEDEPISRDALALALETEGYVVASAANGREAMEYLRSRPPPDLIVLDLQMPVMDGWELLRALKAEPGLAAVPVVVLSGGGDAGGRARALGIADYLQKPLPVEELATRIRRCAPPEAILPSVPAGG